MNTAIRIFLKSINFVKLIEVQLFINCNNFSNHYDFSNILKTHKFGIVRKLQPNRILENRKKFRKKRNYIKKHYDVTFT